MVSENQVLRKLCNVLRGNNLKCLESIAEVEASENITGWIEDQIVTNYHDMIKDNNQWLTDCNQKLRHLAAIAGK